VEGRAWAPARGRSAAAAGAQAAVAQVLASRRCSWMGSSSVISSEHGSDRINQVGVIVHAGDSPHLTEPGRAREIVAVPWSIVVRHHEHA
jgi:hypothetical protein